jgi:hypothetical protein
VGGTGDLAEAVVPHLVHGGQAALVDLGADIDAQLAVHRLPDGVVVLEGEADAVDRRGGHQGGQDQAGQGEEVDRAGAQLRQHVGVGTQLVVGEHLDVDLAVGGGLDAGGGFQLAHGLRMGDGGVVRQLQAEGGRSGGACVDGEQRQRGPGEQGAAVQGGHVGDPRAFLIGVVSGGQNTRWLPRGKGFGGATADGCFILLTRDQNRAIKQWNLYIILK